jgi:RimJ/RimL family protein N-acetyltransferase
MQLITPRLLLREFLETDWQAMLDYQQDPRYLQYYEWEERSRLDVQQLLGMFIHWQNEKPRRKFQFAVCLLGQTQMIGNCGIRKDHYDSLQADIGYELAPAAWSCGYATEAARRIIQFGFEELGVQRITAECVEENLASRRVLERCGLQFFERQDAHLMFKGRDWNILVYAIERQQWAG